MLKGKLQHGDQVRVDVTSLTVASGDPLLIGARLVGVALIDKDASNHTTLKRNGSVMLSVEGVNQSGNSAVVIGDLLYITMADDPRINKKNTGVAFGIALGAVASGETAEIEVLLLG